MSKLNGRKISSKISSVRLNRRNNKPEVILISPNNPTRIKQSNQYRKLNLQQSDTTSLSDNNNNSILSKNQRLSAKETKLASSFQYKNDSKHDEASVSSVNTIVDEMKSPRNGSESLSMKLENRAEIESKNRMSILRNNWAKHSDVPYVIGANITESESDTFGKILLAISWFFIVLFFPISLFVIIKVVQEYE